VPIQRRTHNRQTETFRSDDLIIPDATWATDERTRLLSHVHSYCASSEFATPECTRALFIEKLSRPAVTANRAPTLHMQLLANL
jgi:hypothetical protein